MPRDYKMKKRRFREERKHKKEFEELTNTQVKVIEEKVHCESEADEEVGDHRPNY